MELLLSEVFFCSKTVDNQYLNTVVTSAGIKLKELRGPLPLRST